MRAWWLAVGAFAVVGCHTLLAPVPQEYAPPEPDDSLTLAAKCLQDGDESAACVHLEAHVRAHPEQLMFRAHLAELLMKLGKDAEARRHFERFITDAQTAAGA